MVAFINNLRPSLKSESLGLTCQPVYHTLLQANEISYLKLKGGWYQIKKNKKQATLSSDIHTSTHKLVYTQTCMHKHVQI